MASSKIKGITIEINGNTTKLQDALKGVDKQVYGLNSDLKALNQALKLDPKNVELLAQKQDVLQRNIQATTERLNTLKDAQKQMGDYNKLTDEQKESYNQLSLEIAKAESALNSMNQELKETTKIDLSKFKDSLKKVGEVALDVSKKILKISAAIGGALTGVIVAGVKSYADLEKAQKGSERLFGKSFNIVEKNAKSAYKTMGLSATQYYDQVNTYVVGLKNSLKGNTKKAAQLANSVLIAQADIVAATGANQDTVQNAFAAVMRGNYTMLDNLRLGIKGSKQGMQEVINKVNAWNKAHGKATHYQMENYADMQQALVDYTKMVGVAGTAEKQMADTISGSFTQMKAAFSNFLSGVSDSTAISGTINQFLKNIVKAVRKIMPAILDGLYESLYDLIPTLLDILYKDVPKFVKKLKEFLTKLIHYFADAIFEQESYLEEIITEILNDIIEFISDNLQIIVDVGITIILTLAKALVNALPKLVPAVIQCILEIVDTIVENIDYIIDSAFLIIDTIITTLIDSIDLLIDAGFKIIIALLKGIIKAIPKIIEKIPEIIVKIVDALEKELYEIFDVGVELINQLWEGIKSTWEWLKEKIQSFGSWFINEIKEVFGLGNGKNTMLEKLGEKAGGEFVEGVGWAKKDAQQAGTDLVLGLKNGINNSDAQSKVLSSASIFGTRVLNALKKSLKEQSPSKATEEMGAFLDLGLQEGIEKNARSVIQSATMFGDDVINGMTRAVNDTNTAMRSLTSGVEASVNPTINPTANSNPLYITIDKFYNNRETDIQQLAEELEFYRKNSALAKGGV